MRSRQFHLVRRPAGAFRVDDMALVGVELPEPGPGQVLVRNVALSVDPYMRPKMDDVPSYTPPYDLHSPMEGRAVGEVVESHDPRVEVGAVVVHREGWRDAAVVDADDVRVLPETSLPLTAHLGVLGIAGFTAWAGVTRVARVAPGDRVWVSAAAGAVGALAGQMARLRGASRVVGSTGSLAKVRHLVEKFGYDAGVDHSAGSGEVEGLLGALRTELPDGCDVYFDNVGGRHLAAALALMNDHGRVAMCGAVSGYEADRPRHFEGNLFDVIRKRLTLQGFLLRDHEHLHEEFWAETQTWIESGDLAHEEWVCDGLESAPRAFVDMLAGRNTGKTVVRLRPTGRG